MATLQEQISVVQEYRAGLTILQAMEAKREEEFRQAHRVLFSELANAKQLCAEAEQALRDMTLQAFKETGNKAPAPGVGIRLITRLIYDASQAFGWAKQHGLALKLDTTTFEKIAKVNKPDFVAIAEEPQATIATDLNRIV